MEALMTREEALIRLMKEHQSDVWRYLRFIGCEAMLAEDLTQEVFIYVFRNPIEEISRNHTAAYLRKSARNRFLNWMRRAKREVSIEALDAADTAWDALTPLERSDDRLDALERCLEKLGERARNAIHLKYRDAQKEAEVAEKLDTSLEAAKALLKRARAQLKDCIERQVQA
jgi:RNA polymerase sigma factor (sigma-70 family)